MSEQRSRDLSEMLEQSREENAHLVTTHQKELQLEKGVGNRKGHEACHEQTKLVIIIFCSQKIFKILEVIPPRSLMPIEHYLECFMLQNHIFHNFLTAHGQTAILDSFYFFIFIFL